MAFPVGGGLAAPPEGASAPGETTCPIARHEEKCTELHRLQLSEDVFTSAMISLLEVPDQKGKDKVNRIGGQVMSVFVLLLTVFIQLYAAYAVYTFVNNREDADISILNVAYQMFITNNMTMPIGISQRICGEYEQIEAEEGPGSVLKMPDGTTYGPSDDIPTFYSTKMPGGSWDYLRLGDNPSIIDESMYVAHHNPLWEVQSGFNLLFFLMLSMWFLTLFVEVRNIGRFARVTAHFAFLPSAENVGPPIAHKDGGYELQYLTKQAKIAGVLIVVLRSCVASFLALVGTNFLLWTSSSISLIMNSLALVFILEIDQIFFQATASTLRQYLIQDLKAVTYPPVSNTVTMLEGVNKYAKIWWPVLALGIAFFLAWLARYVQINWFTERFHAAVSVCMFLGPTPHGIPGLVAPATGMCDSLLRTTCAPEVNGTGQAHGHCVVTDQGSFEDPTVKLYVDGKLFIGSKDSKAYGGKKVRKLKFKKFLEWGPPRRELTTGRPQRYDWWTHRSSSAMWDDDAWHNELRKACTSMYQPTGSVDSRVVDPDTGEVMNGAPFYCAKKKIFDAVFGDTENRLRKSRRLEQVVRSVFDLPVQKALAKCRMSDEESRAYFAEHQESSLQLASAALPRGARPGRRVGRHRHGRHRRKTMAPWA